MADIITLKPMNIGFGELTIIGTTPLIQHAFSTKAREMMREKHAGKKTKNRDARDPVAEFNEAMYRTEDGQHYGIPAPNIKGCLVTAAHKDLGIEKTLIRKGIFVHRNGGDFVLPMRCSEPWMREDFVRVGAGSTDLRYRPQFDEWELDVSFEYDMDLLTMDTICALFNRAGFGVGLHEWRPEKDGENGRFKIK